MSSSASAWAVIVAAGGGRRFGANVPKQFALLAGRPLLLWTLAPFLDHPALEGLTVVLPPEHAKRPPPWLQGLRSGAISLVAGGPARTDSVRLGLASVPEHVELVVVHDGARPLVTGRMISQVLERAGPEFGAVAGRPVSDSLKEADAEGHIERSLSRERLWWAETPQVFPRALLVEAHRRAEAEGFSASDCAGLCERYGVASVLVEISEPNPKVTNPDDMRLIEAWLRAREAGTVGPGS